MIVDLISFAFSKKEQPDANYIIDVRFLNNPFYIDELRSLTGLDNKVIDFFKKDIDTNKFANELFEWIKFILELNKKASKEKIVIAIGCTGGQHRSPYIVESLAKYLTNNKLVSELSIYHSELTKYNVTV